MIRGLITIVFFPLLLLGARCSAAEEPVGSIENREDVVSYSLGISGVSHPFTLGEELSELDARRAGRYFRGTFTEGKLTRLERYIDRKILFVYEYSYYPDGTLAQAILRSGDEEPRVLDYDERGRLVETRPAEPASE